MLGEAPEGRVLASGVVCASGTVCMLGTLLVPCSVGERESTCVADPAAVDEPSGEVLCVPLGVEYSEASEA